MACDLVDEPISYGDEPLTVRLSIVTAEGEALTLEEHLVPPAAEGSPDATDDDDLVLDRHLASRIGTSSSDDPTIGAPGDAAKDVAERVALAVFGEDYVAMSAADVGAVTEVTMEGASGTVVAEVAFDTDLGGERLIQIRPADGPAQIGAVAADGGLTLEVPEDGALSYRMLRRGARRS